LSDVQKADSLPWLLEPENPSVRHFALTDILDRPADDPEVHAARAAMEYLLSRQLPDSTWPLDQSPHYPPFDPGQLGEPDKGLTLDALRVVKLLQRGGNDT
jgi:hypothetical protein